MKRNSLAAAALLVLGVGLVDPYACVQYSTGGSLQPEIPKAERDRLLRTAKRALAAIPAPGAPYALDRESESASVEPRAAWDDAASRWMAPGVARAERVYAPDEEGTDAAPPPLEVRVFVNAATGVPTSLASVGGAPRWFRIEGAAAVEVTTLGAGEGASEIGPRDGSEGDGTDGGRVMMPVSPTEAARAITVIRIVVADAGTERMLRETAEGRAVERAERERVARADRVESVTVELYGAKRDVEALARRVPTKALRELLTK
jgi:hypothetical protein